MPRHHRARPPTRRPRVRVRDLRCGDVATVRRVLDQLEPSSLARRFHAPVGALTGRMVAAIAATDERSRLVVVADVRERRAWRPVGLCEVAATGPDEAEVAMCVADAWQGRGIGRRLADAAATRAVAVGLERLHADIALDNRAALQLAHRVSPAARSELDGACVRLSIHLGSTAHVITAEDIMRDLCAAAGH